MIVGLSAIGEGVVGASGLAAAAAVGAEEQSVAGRRLLDNCRRISEERGKKVKDCEPASMLVS